VLVAPSLLSADFSRLGEEVAALEQAGADWVHFDVMDGHFVPPITIGPRTVEHCRRYARLPFDVHVMIENPEHIARVLDTIRKAGLKPGICLNPGSPLTLVEPVLKEADLLVMMCVNPGWGGQTFIDGSLDRIKDARALRDRLNPALDIEIDGGVTAETGRQSVQAGATVLVAGNFVYTHPRGKKAAIDQLR